MMLISATLTYVDGKLVPGMVLETDGTTVLGLRLLKPGETVEQHVHLLMPGCTDIQVNGGGGVLFNTTPTPDGIAAIREAHYALGTVDILPTVITDTPAILEQAAEAIIATKGSAGIAGIHIEGPHIAPVCRGTHAERFIRPLDTHTMTILERLRLADIPVLLTLAPECNDLALIRQAVEMGVVISAGHSAATAKQARAGLDAGISMFTHLYNGMSKMTPREPGIVGAAILSNAYCGLITDGIHSSAEAMRIALAARPVPDRTFIVSDAMPTVGGPDHFSLYDMDIRVENDRLVNSEGALAGAHIDMVTSISRLHKLTGTPLETAIAMATDIPRNAMRLPPLRIEKGLQLNRLIALTDDLILDKVFLCDEDKQN